MNLGYACINMTLSSQKIKVTTNRGMIRKTFNEKGVGYAGDLALLNICDLNKVIRWNVEHNIRFFRMSSDIFPWASRYDFSDLSQFSDIKSELNNIGEYVKKHKVRLTFHPGPFNVLVSPRESVVDKTILELTVHGEIFDLMGLSQTPYNKINIHCNGVYGDKIAAMDRFCENFYKLPVSVQSRLTIENDDKASMYSVKDLMYIYEKTGVPIVFDYHHHKFCTGGLSEKEALKLAVSTWPDGIKPVVHYSESKSIHEKNNKIKPQAHSDYINHLPELYGFYVDVMVEAKAKELSILPFLN